MPPGFRTRWPFRKALGRHRRQFSQILAHWSCTFQQLIGLTRRQNFWNRGRVAKVGLAKQRTDMATTGPEAGYAAPEGRVTRRRRATRARLLEAAYDVMMESGVDAAKIKDIT